MRSEWETDRAIEQYADTVRKICMLHLKNEADTEDIFQTVFLKYAMYPVWLLNAKWNDQTFLFAMNGQTGKFVGNLPLDKGAWWRWFLLSWLIGAGVAFAIAMLINVL